MMTGELSSSEAVITLVACSKHLETTLTENRTRTDIIGVPSNGTHTSTTTKSESTSTLVKVASASRTSTTAVLKCGDFPLATKIPDYSVSRATGCTEDVSDLVIPS